ncbi:MULTISPECIES: hypothetical protein [Acidobacteriaceae]|uniref:hypothetical protein n=1 Tax=Acidobacteriaceae TaxID=204434 RepID=UPI00131AA2CD|nr:MULTISPECIES: hypothetical protein [Acidobacteriaceae]MDW5267334.1 hypothetical protein [Edaphobacter sp.]
MTKTKVLPITFFPAWLFLVAGLAVLAARPSYAAPPSQKTLPAGDSANVPHRTRLYLKDGSYQIVMSYRVSGSLVHYVSAERDGAAEEIPLSLVDLDATHRWEKEHSPAQTGDNSTSGEPPAIDPELLKEEADRASLTPEVAKDLSLPEQNSVLALDTFHGTPELVPLSQNDSDLNRNTGHNILRAVINPLSSPHQVAQIKGERSYVQLHVASPVFYIRVGDDTVAPTGGTPLTVDTHGASNAIKPDAASGSTSDRYVIVRADVRTGVRDIASFRIGLLGNGQPQEDVVETTSEVLPGGHWMKLTPQQPLDFGEYALMEVISDKVVNLSVWDFGVHPVAPENRDVIKPEPKRPLTLEHRRPE